MKRCEDSLNKVYVDIMGSRWIHRYHGRKVDMYQDVQESLLKRYEEGGYVDIMEKHQDVQESYWRDMKKV